MYFKSSTKLPRRRLGFWLACAGLGTVEIAVVAAIAAVVTGAALPLVNRTLDRFRLDTEVYALASELQLAKVQALTTTVNLRKN